MTWDDMYSPTVEAGAEFDEFQANYVPASQVINSLAEQSNYWWKIDKNGDLFFLPKEYRDSGYVLEKSDIKGKPEVKQGNPLYRNVQYVKGAQNTTDEQTETQFGDGEKQSFVVGYNIKEVNSVEVDRGDGFQFETFGLKGREEGKNWYWERNNDTITQDDDETLLASTDRVRITYIGMYPAVTQERNDDAIANQQEIETTTTGRVEDAVSENIEGRDAALDFANRKLTKYAQESTTLSWETRHTEHEAGHLIEVNLPEFELDGEKLLITKVTVRDQNGHIFYDVEAVRGPRHQTWSEFFNELKVRAEKEFREGISAEDVLVIPYDFEKTWTDDDKPNIFRLIYPDTGDIWEEGFDISQSWNNYDTERWSEGRFDLFPDNDVYSSFEADDRVRYIAFYRAGDEVFRKEISQQSPPGQPPIESETYIGPEEFTGTINDIKWFGGFRASQSVYSGVEIDSINFEESKTELEAYQITRIDRKEGDY